MAPTNFALDFAVLQIALHTALYIFKPNVVGGEGGLYPYRKLAYFGWVVFPSLMASLAFINNDGGYTSVVTYCYLPVRPFWYRLALSWIPRYVIFIIILFVYASIYYYVRYKFQGFKKVGQGQGDVNSNSLDSEIPQRPPTPILACHGLIPETRPLSVEDGPKDLMPGNPNRDRKPSVHGFMWANLIGSTVPPPLPTLLPESSMPEADSFVDPSTPHPLPSYVAASPNLPRSPRSSLTAPSRSRATSWRDPFVRRISHNEAANTSPSLVDVMTVLRHPDGSDSTPLSQLQLTNTQGQSLTDVEIVRTREKIRRQLRFLFIYPLVYIGMWVVPFASHVLQYDDNLVTKPPFGLSCATTIFICSQAAVDCWLFSTREKPWKHMPGNDGSLWGSLKFWSDWKNSSKTKVVHGPGKMRDEMIREARAAYRRRDEELAQRRMESAIGSQLGGAVRREREWWDGAVVTKASIGEESTNTVTDIMASKDTEAEEGGTTLSNVNTRSSVNTDGTLNASTSPTDG